MEEENNKVKIPLIDDKAVASIEVSTHFYNRLKAIFFYLLEGKEQEEIVKILAEVGKHDTSELPEDPLICHIHTLMLYIKDLEDSFSNGGFIKEEEVDIPKTQD